MQVDVMRVSVRFTKDQISVEPKSGFSVTGLDQGAPFRQTPPDALVEYRKDREFREQQQQLALSAEDAAKLSEMRYRGGATSYLEVLTNETTILMRSWDSLRRS